MVSLGAVGGGLKWFISCVLLELKDLRSDPQRPWKQAKTGYGGALHQSLHFVERDRQGAPHSLPRQYRQLNQVQGQ